MHGEGKWRKGMVESANTYEGQFENNMKHGKGIFTWGNSGNKYEGDFKFDYRNGFGIYTWLDGNKYEGYWEKDKMHGQGKMIHPEGEKQIGYYDKGKYKGKTYNPIQRKRQVLKLYKDIKKYKQNKSILAVGGDDLLFNSKFKIKKASKRIKQR